MKLKHSFVIREVAGETLLIPSGRTALDLNGMLTLNELGAEIYRMLPEVENEQEIVARILQSYDAERAEVEADVAAFLGRLRALGIL